MRAERGTSEARIKLPSAKNRLPASELTPMPAADDGMTDAGIILLSGQDKSYFPLSSVLILNYYHTQDIVFQNQETTKA